MRPPATPSRSPWPLALPPPNPGVAHVEAAAEWRSRLAAATTLADVAAAWARALETPVEGTLWTQSTLSTPPGLPHAHAVWRAEDDLTGTVSVPTHLVCGVVQRLAGLPSTPAGPAPLSPAEEGLFAYLLLLALDVVGGDRLTLEWIHGGDPAWPLPRVETGPVCWRMRIGDQRGVVTWCPPAARRPLDRVAKVPVPVRICATVRVDPGALRAGAWIPALGLGLVTAAGDGRGEGSRWPLKLEPGLATSGARLRLIDPLEEPMRPPDLETLPVALTIELGSMTLTAGQLADLRSGDLLSLNLESPPVVRLLAGDRIVAVGALVEADGQVAVQITQVRLSD